MQQALDYATTLNIPFVFSSNGDGFVFHDRTGLKYSIVDQKIQISSGRANVL
jgi:type I restriction enzyme R subunit